MRTAGPGLGSLIRNTLAGILPAPDQYRIGLSLALHFLELHAHIRPEQSLPLIEFLSYALALILLYLLFRCSPRVENATDSHRLVLLGFFLAATQFPILWIFPWERWEVLPTTFYLAAIVILIVRRSRIPFALVCLLAAMLSLGQALMRAEVPVALGAAILLSAALAIPFPRPRSHIAILGLLCVAIGGAIQLYLQRIAYPNATYSPTTPRFQLLANLDLIHPPLHIPIFLTALLPLIVGLVLLQRHRLPLDPSDKLVLLICLSISRYGSRWGWSSRSVSLSPFSSSRPPRSQSFGQPTCSTMSMAPSLIGPHRSARPHRHIGRICRCCFAVVLAVVWQGPTARPIF